jgi:hypothetical protein
LSHFPFLGDWFWVTGELRRTKRSKLTNSRPGRRNLPHFRPGWRVFERRGAIYPGSRVGRDGTNLVIRHWRQADSIELIDHDSVAPAGVSFQSGAIEDRNASSIRADEAGLLKRMEYIGNAGPPDAEHERQKLLRQRDFVGVGAVARHQQSATASFMNRMQAVAGGGLHTLSQKGGQIAANQPCELAVPLGRAPELTALDSLGMPVGLDKTSKGRDSRFEE